MAHSFTHLTLDERRLLARLRDAGVPVARIAERLGRHASTIYRELKRNHFADDVLVDVTGYFAVADNDFAKERRARSAKPPGTTISLPSSIDCGRFGLPSSSPVTCGADRPG